MQKKRKSFVSQPLSVTNQRMPTSALYCAKSNPSPSATIQKCSKNAAVYAALLLFFAVYVHGYVLTSQLQRTDRTQALRFFGHAYLTYDLRWLGFANHDRTTTCQSNCNTG